jgi:hypothetical protein
VISIPRVCWAASFRLVPLGSTRSATEVDGLSCPANVPVGAENPYCSHGVRVFVDNPADPVASADSEAVEVADGRWDGLTGCGLVAGTVGVAPGVGSFVVAETLSRWR